MAGIRKFTRRNSQKLLPFLSHKIFQILRRYFYEFIPSLYKWDSCLYFCIRNKIIQKPYSVTQLQQCPREQTLLLTESKKTKLTLSIPITLI